MDDPFALVKKRLQDMPVIPVLAPETLEDGLRVCELLVEGGLPVAEFTFRTPLAAEIIAEGRKRFPGVLLGVGTVTSVEQMRRAIDAGAQFGVAPGCNPEVIAAARSGGVPFFPGVLTPTEIDTAVRNGCLVVKFFPAGVSGGLAYLNAAAAPTAHLGIRYIPTGGVDLANMAGYLSCPHVIAAGGTFVAKPAQLKSRDWSTIAANISATVAAVKEWKKARR
jgi:2-dehydro-3-deoxyphosphogluconate aldolase/(4S)-4-hydroxy-2-oxoglutarate aldolase